MLSLKSQKKKTTFKKIQEEGVNSASKEEEGKKQVQSMIPTSN
jgi:hypothetical protein